MAAHVCAWIQQHALSALLTKQMGRGPTCETGLASCPLSALWSRLRLRVGADSNNRSACLYTFVCEQLTYTRIFFLLHALCV